MRFPFEAVADATCSRRRCARKLRTYLSLGRFEQRPRKELPAGILYEQKKLALEMQQRAFNDEVCKTLSLREAKQIELKAEKNTLKRSDKTHGSVATLVVKTMEML